MIHLFRVGIMLLIASFASISTICQMQGNELASLVFSVIAFVVGGYLMDVYAREKNNGH